ncbi:MAG: HNH endonuclease [bacterium]|nr:HNH endonuclease [bacterium]
MDKLSEVEKLILETYVAGETSLRDVATLCQTDHHRVKRVLVKHGVEIVKAKKKPLSEKQRDVLEKHKFKKGHKKGLGRKCSKIALYRNMRSHLRWDVTEEWLMKFEDIEKLKTLHKMVSKRSGRWDCDVNWYRSYIEKFYYDDTFCKLFDNWKSNNQYSWLKPSLDHIVPKASGGGDNIENLQVLTWFENRCKWRLSQEEWDDIKSNISLYISGIERGDDETC